MADKKISQLTSLAQGDIATTTDVLAIVDTSATETKKATPAAIVGAAAAAGLTNVDINSGAIDGTTIGANSAAAGTFTNLTASGTVSFSGATVSNGGSVTTVDINGGTIDGASVGASSASSGAFTTLSASGNVTLSGGTANGVLYLNGSKVATSGSALTFDGTNLGVGVTLSAWKSGARAIQSGANGYLSLWEQTNGSTNLGFGVYESASNTFAYRTTGDAPALYSQLSGQHIWSNAASGTANATFSFTELMRLTSTGLGIGTSSPGVKLDVVGDARFGSGSTTNAYVARFYNQNSNLYIGVDNAAGSNTGVAYNTYFLGLNAYPMTFYTNSTERLRITSDGNLGIGTSSPVTKLNVVDSTTNSYVAAFRGVGGTNLVALGTTSGGASIAGFTAGFAAATDLIINPGAGNLGLGVTPSAWNSAHKVIDIGTFGAVDNEPAVNGFNLVSNGYYNASNQWIYKNTAAASLFRLNEGGFKFFTAASGTAGTQISLTQAMTLDASGNLGVGATSPAFALGSGLEVQRAGIATLRLENSSGSNSIEIAADSTTNGIRFYGLNNAPFVFAPNATERARITTGGDLLVNLTGFTYSNEKFAVLADNNQEAAAFKTDAGATTYAVVVSNTASSGDNKFIAFATESTDTIRGSITYNRGAGQVAYNITSDARLKENIADSNEAGSKIDAMQVRQFDWKETGNHLDYGFVAQELHAVAPHAVSKPEDEDAMWSVDYSKLVPMLVKEIQSLRARVAQLESK